MKYLQDSIIENKKIILRVDLNVSIKDNKILDDTKIKKIIPTLNHLLNKNNHILIMSHLGRIKSEEDKNNNSLKIVCDRLIELTGLNISFINDTKGSRLEESILNNEITLMENTRYEDYPYNKESKCDEELSRYWASLGDIYINDAFATSHRKHASNYGISKYLETYIGFLIQKEIEELDPIINVKKRPFVVIMGGSKVDDKITLINNILKECDYLLVGGGIANTFLKASSIEIGSSLCSNDYIDNVKEIINIYKDKIILPMDYVIKDGTIVNKVNQSDEILDIGTKTIDLYSKYINEAALIFINGTVGKYEEELYSNGTRSILNAIANTSSVKIAGGGDALTSINKYKLNDKMTYISTGGGATLEYIAEKKIKCMGE